MSATIGKISESLKNLLEAEMTPTTKVTLLSPADTSTQNVRVNLFLYRIVKIAQLNNRDWQPKPGTINQVVFPPLSLSLFYMMTTFSPLDVETGLADTHGLMGEAMRVLYENAIVPGAFLESGLVPGQVKINLLSLDVEELSKIWTALNKDYRLSAAYEVSFVDVPAKREALMPVRVSKPAVDVIATARMPAVATMQPMSGPAGTIVEFGGANLAGWKATIRIGGVAAAQDQQIFDDRKFTATVPNTLQPGLYVVDADVGHVTRFRNAFQVTP